MEALPELLPAVQAELLDVLALVLAQRTFQRTSPLRRNALTVALAAGTSFHECVSASPKGVQSWCSR